MAKNIWTCPNKTHSSVYLKKNETNCRIETKWTIEAVVKTKLQIVNYYNYM